MISGQTLGGVSQLPMLIASYEHAGLGSLQNLNSQLGSGAEELSRTFRASPPLAPFSAGSQPRPSSILIDLKRRAFPESGRSERIAKSLVALSAAQLTRLSPPEWKRIAEADIEDQY